MSTDRLALTKPVVRRAGELATRRSQLLCDRHHTRVILGRLILRSETHSPSTQISKRLTVLDNLFDKLFSLPDFLECIKDVIASDN